MRRTGKRNTNDESLNSRSSSAAPPPCTSPDSTIRKRLCTTLNTEQDLMSVAKEEEEEEVWSGFTPTFATNRAEDFRIEDLAAQVVSMVQGKQLLERRLSDSAAVQEHRSTFIQGRRVSDGCIAPSPSVNNLGDLLAGITVSRNDAHGEQLENDRQLHPRPSSSI